MRERKGGLWLLIGLLLATLAGGLAFTTLQRVTALTAMNQETRQPVVVAGRAVPMGTVLTAADLEVKDLPADAIPPGAVTSLDQALGKMTIQELAQGEILLAGRLGELSKQGAGVSFTIEEGKLVLALPAADLMSSIGLLKAGDRVDLLFTLFMTPPGEEQVQEHQVTFNALQNLQISAVVVSSPVSGKTNATPAEKIAKPQALLLALDPQDALVLKYLKDAQGILDVALRAPNDTQTFEVKPVEADYLIDRYQIRLPK